MRVNKFVLALVILAVALIPAGIASADDTVVTPGFFTQTPAAGTNPNNGIIWYSTQIGYLVYQDTSSTSTAKLYYIRTVNAGLTWSTPVEIAGGSIVTAYSVWYDRWTQGITSQYIHIVWYETASPTTIQYARLNATNNSITSESTIATFGTYFGSADSYEVSVVRTESGRLYAHGFVGNSNNTTIMTYSDNDGSSWSSGVNDGYGTIPMTVPPTGGRLAPAISNSVFLIDSNDVYMIFRSSVWQYQSTVNSWVQVGTYATGASNKYVSLAVNTTAGTAAASGSVPYLFFATTVNETGLYENIKVAKMASNSVVTNVTQPVSSIGSTISSLSLMYDDATERLYLFYAKASDTDIRYKYSDDYGDTWSLEMLFDNNSNTKGDIALPSTVNRSGGNLYPVWEESGALQTNLDEVQLLTTEPTDEGNKLERRIFSLLSWMGINDEGGRILFSLVVMGIVLIFCAIKVDTFIGIIITAVLFGGFAATDLIPPWLFLASFQTAGLTFTLTEARQHGTTSDAILTAGIGLTFILVGLIASELQVSSSIINIPTDVTSPESTGFWQRIASVLAPFSWAINALGAMFQLLTFQIDMPFLANLIIVGPVGWITFDVIFRRIRGN